MNKLAILALLIAVKANAVSIGIKEDGLNKSLIIADYAKLDPNHKDYFGLRRYGIGRGQIELGAPVGFFADANNGIFLSDKEGLVTGLELWSGSIAHQGTNKLAWRPGMSLGLRHKSFYAGPRLLYNASNNAETKQGLGVGSVIQAGPLTYWENPGMKIYSLSLKTFNIEKRNNDLFFFSVTEF